MPAKRKTLQDEVAEVMSTCAEPSAPPAKGSHEPVGLRPVTSEDLAADRAFIAQLDAAAGPETTDDALGEGAADVHETTATEELKPAEDEADDAPPAAVSVAAPSRGGVNALVTRLLGDPALSYDAIVAAVRAEHPGANTTARSVASTASVLRRKGTQVPMRRGPKA